MKDAKFDDETGLWTVFIEDSDTTYTVQQVLNFIIISLVGRQEQVLE